jgi:ribosomal protein S18 acetylase RimI-like enzyme
MLGDRFGLFIRKAKLEDLEEIADFNFQMAKETEGKILDKNLVREGVRAALSDEIKGFYLVAEDKSTKLIVGQLMVTFEWSDWRNKNFWWIQSVYVDQKYRNKKVFSQLYEKVTELAISERNVCGLRLYTGENNFSAKKVYESLGMKKTLYEIYEKPLSI